MSAQLQIDFEAARVARDEGIALAAEHTGPDWMDVAIADFVRFVRERGETTCEQWRYDWLTCKRPAPASHYAWGALVNIAAKRGLVVNTHRYVKASSKKTHAHPVPLWRAA